ncbi:UNVERIFIED_CONTAM: hypothetical protein FKN15_036142 [Acipenser sinensis]
MGRKSNKAKGKKQKRLEERAAMDAVCARVESANKVESCYRVPACLHAQARHG